ncbi:hypothetical protein EST38_g13091 [Candolleomyces aberdarensis]|uniref:Uncharacterized protein n=1 Tax=Candolleomyces aberdarensis TaxID=2316362 RepID=A0A4Q2D334_9AGAR|nr:hypothetical protein EST38_g13091 [Candolleomyces aberdarensis]
MRFPTLISLIASYVVLVALPAAAGNNNFHGEKPAFSGEKPAVIGNIGAQIHNDARNSVLKMGAGAAGSPGEKPVLFGDVGIQGGGKDVGWFGKIGARGRPGEKAHPTIEVGVEIKV